MNVETGAEAEQFPEKEYKRNCRCSVYKYLAQLSLKLPRMILTSFSSMASSWPVISSLKLWEATTSNLFVSSDMMRSLWACQQGKICLMDKKG